MSSAAAPAGGTDKTSGRVKPFATMLQEVDGGKAHLVLSDLMRQLVAAVRDTGRKGKLTIAVTVTPVADSVENMVVTISPKLDAPTDYERQAVFFVDREANLTREDPHQQALNSTMPLRVIGEAR